jgi:hypothetical protein
LDQLFKLVIFLLSPMMPSFFPEYYPEQALHLERVFNLTNFPSLTSIPLSLKRPMMPYYSRQFPTGGVHFTFAVCFPPLSVLISGRSTWRDIVMIAWVVTKQPYTSSRTTTGWRSVTYFSSLPNGWIPHDGVDFFEQLLNYLRTKWVEHCEDGAQMLTASRHNVLKKGGRDQHLIRRLLDEASLWMDLQTYLKAQVDESYKFASDYKDLDDNEEALNKLPGLIRELDEFVRARLERLNATSQDLIQTVRPRRFQTMGMFENANRGPLAYYIGVQPYINR